MKFITEEAQAQIVDDLAEAVLSGTIARSTITATINAYSQASEVEFEDVAEVAEEVEAVVSIVESIKNGLTLEEACAKLDLSEKVVKKVSVADRLNGGSLISKQLDRATRARKAAQNTGLSKSKRLRTARKAAKTRKRQKGTSKERKANKLRAKSMKKRDQMGL